MLALKDLNKQQIKYYIQIIILLGVALSLFFTFAPTLALPLFSIITIVAMAYLLAQFNLANFFLLMVFLIPLSINLQVFDSDVTLRIPSEPLEAIIMLAFVIKLLFGYQISLQVLKHPIFLSVLLVLILQYLALISSTMPIVSIKTVLLKTTYFMVFFVLAADLYVKQELNHIAVLKSYTFSILLVGVIIFLKHLDYGLSKDLSGSVTEPFYADHTIYGACLAFVIPLPMLTIINRKKLKINFYQGFWLLCLFVLLLTFFFYTYCRAGWISFFIAITLVIAVNYGLKFKGLLFLILSAATIFFIFQQVIFEEIKQNKADSNAKNASIEQQTKSVTNITSDQSNAERLNRWSCAYRMFLDRPYFGYGPGTYQFEYLSYQKKTEMTRISVISPYNIKKGKGGSAHSEYLLLLSEAGIFSFTVYLLSILITIYYAIKVFTQSNNERVRVKMLVVFFGFCTYILHAFFNNFLDTDKAALLYYTSIAAIIAESISLKKIQQQKTST